MHYATMDLAQPMPVTNYHNPAYIEPKPLIDILLVEDNTSDAMLAEISLDETDINYKLHTLKNGAQVVPYLLNQLKARDGHIPDALILDLSLPAVDGFEILSTLTEIALISESISKLPIIILTGDTHCVFLKRCYGLNIVEYIIKPCSTQKIKAAMKAIYNIKNK